MVMSPFRLREDYWETFELHEEDIEFLYNILLETEEPQTSSELVENLVSERIRIEKQLIETQRSSGGQLYMPKERYEINYALVFPALNWQKGKVTGKRPGHNPDIGDFEVIEVAFEDGVIHEYASALENHFLNTPPSFQIDDKQLDLAYILEYYQEDLIEAVERELESNPDFVRIAGRWFPRALLVDITIGHLNLAEAVLDMAGGGPLPTSALLEQLEFDGSINPKLLEFSMDLALQEDERFDEVGSAGKVLWFLHRLEPPEVLEPPLFLRYAGMEYDRSLLTGEMQSLERELDDELSPLEGRYRNLDNLEVHLLYPHWRAGTLPVSARLRHLFPTAYEAPRIRFTMVDGETHSRFPAWVVRAKRYVYGLRDWYQEHGIQPGSIIRVRAGDLPGEVTISSDSRRQSREWIRTVLVGSDGGVVFAMLKQTISSSIDDRMVISVPDIEAVDQVWERMQKERPSFERVVANTIKELAKLNPQGHVHASELYAAINVVRRTPPGPLLALLASRSIFEHLGDMHYRLIESERST
jgi:hypothetical protein